MFTELSEVLVADVVPVDVAAADAVLDTGALGQCAFHVDHDIKGLLFRGLNRLQDTKHGETSKEEKPTHGISTFFQR